MKLSVHLFAAVFSAALISAEGNSLKDKPATIFYPEGHYLAGWPRDVGNDLFGYNYQAHKFNGYFANIYLGGDGLPPYSGDSEAYYTALVDYGFADSEQAAEEMMSAWWYWPSRDVHMVMKWNDAWLSNQDLASSDGQPGPDGALDRHRGYPTYAKSGAWITNHSSGIYYVEGKNGKMKPVKWTYFIKIITPPSTAYKQDGFWFAEDGTLIGPVRYGSFAAVQIVSNDKSVNEHGKIFGSPLGSGFGTFGPE